MASTKSKVDYWFFLMKMGVKRRGHFAENKKIEWWLFYSSKGK
jgi:hypothetical protein